MRFLDPDTITVTSLYEANTPRSDVTWEGGTALVEGVVLEAAVSMESSDPVTGTLLFMTDDVPGEDSLSITMIDSAYNIVDRARLGGAYTTGSWRDATLDAPGKMSFRFINERRWRLRVLSAPEWKLPLSEPKAVGRPWSLRRHFVLATD